METLVSVSFYLMKWRNFQSSNVVCELFFYLIDNVCYFKVTKLPRVIDVLDLRNVNWSVTIACRRHKCVTGIQAVLSKN